MKLCCPHCRKEVDFMEMKEDADLLAIIRMQPLFGKYSHLAWAYVELFGVLPMRKHTARIRAILEVLKMVFQAEGFTYGRKRYAISAAGIGEALHTVALKNFPERLENHNYLKKVMIGIAEREAREAGGRDEKELRRREERLMAGQRDDCEGGGALRPGASARPGNAPAPPCPAAPEPPVERPSDAQIARNQARLRDLMQRIGGA